MKIETKYDIGQTVFFMLNNKVASRLIIGIIIGRGKDLTEDPKAMSKTIYKLDNSTETGKMLDREEFQIFLTKQELLNSL